MTHPIMEPRKFHDPIKGQCYLVYIGTGGLGYDVLNCLRKVQSIRWNTDITKRDMGAFDQTNSESEIKSTGIYSSLTANGGKETYMASDQFGDHYRRQRVTYPHYTHISVRRNSFFNWPDDKEQTPEILADAGFFFAGVQDCTRCFDCGGGLRNWLPGDLPLAEHARWFPECGYVQQRVGQEFIDNVNINYPRELQINGSDNDNPIGATSAGSENKPPIDFTEIVDTVVKRPCGEALLALGFSLALVKAAITKVLSDCGWDESKVTSDKLARVALDIEESDTDGPAGVNVGYTAEAAKTPPRPEFPSESHLTQGLESLNLLEENRKLKDQMKCKVCMDEDVSIVFLPCGHLVTCSKCYSSLTHCALCRQKVAASVKAYL